MTQSEDIVERREAVELLRTNFKVFPNKTQAWDDLLRLTKDEDNDVRWGVTYALGSVFPHVPDKAHAWNYLLRLTKDKDSDVRWAAAHSVSLVFPYVPDKAHAWDDLLRLAKDKDSDVRWGAAHALGSAFFHVPDKNQAWADLHRLTQDKDSYVRWRTVDALSSAFFQVSNKNQAWADLHRLTQDKDSYVRWRTVYALDSVIPYVPNKNQAWADLIQLTHDEDSNVRLSAAHALGSAFFHVPDKNQAWADLHRLTQDEDNIVRKGVAVSLGSSFPHIPDKNQAWADLHRLAQDKDSWVWTFANHSIGKAYIIRATEATNKEDFKKELEKAIEYFEKSAGEKTHLNPAKFCLPFYKSFYAITFKKQEAEAEAQNYLAKAKSAAGGSESKEKLLEAVTNLENALKVVQKAQKAQEMDFNAMKNYLKTYRQYCERAAELLRTTEEIAPGATKLIKKGLPFIDEKIKEIIVEIQEKANALCKKTKDTSLEPLGVETSRKAKELSTLNDFSLEFEFDSMAATAYKFCVYIPSDKKAVVCGKIDAIKNMSALKKGKIIVELLNYIYYNIEFPRIEIVHISERLKDVIKIAAVQLHFELTDSFPPEIIDKVATKKKILNAIERTRKEKADIVCLPELCIYEEWLPEIKAQYPSMIIIPGSYYDKNNHNICRLILGTGIDVPPQLKFNPSAFEDSRVMGERMVPGEKLINIYETQFGKFAILICRDFGNFIPFLRGRVDMIFVPSYNTANNRFHKDADSHVTNSPSYVIISNTALYGGTSIFGQLDFKYFNTLEQGGCKKKGDSSYKLCEIEKKIEGIIIADFNLTLKSPQKQSPLDPKEEILSVENIQKIIIEL